MWGHRGAWLKAREGTTGPGLWAGGTLGLTLMLAGCSADSALNRADWSWWSGGRQAASLSPAGTPEGLVGPDGVCAVVSDQPGRGVGLGMTECDLVRLAGPADRIEIGANERGQRTAVMTYPQGERAGIYRFTSGVLVSVERPPEPPKPQRPQRPAPRTRPPS